MVRLRTKRWYGSDGQRRSRFQATNQSNSSRRLISLCILLALVLVLIQRASDPRYVRNAFLALGVPLDGQTNINQETTPAAAPLALDSSTEATPPSSRMKRTCQDLIPKVFSDAHGPQLRVFCKLWFSGNRGGNTPGNIPGSSLTDSFPGGVPSPESDEGNAIRQLFVQANARLSEFAPSAEAADPQWSEAFSLFSKDFQQLNISLVSAENASQDCRLNLSWEFVLALTDYLDTYLMGTLRDAAPWESSESLAFWRLLQRTREPLAMPREGTMDEKHPPMINTLQLESERSVYRGSIIRYQGSVRRAEWIEKQYPDFELTEGYGVLWLRGADRSQQPIAIYSTDKLVKELSAQQLDAADSSDFPEIEVTGIVAKRLAYGSTAGVQVAPTIFASRLTLLGGPPTATVAAPQALNIAGMILAATLLAGAILVPLLLGNRWRNAKSTREEITRRALLFLLIGSATFQANVVFGVQITTEAAAVPTEDVPPWAREDGDAKLALLLTNRLRDVLDSAAVANLKVYILGEEQATFPNTVLKTMHAISQLGWQRAIGLGKLIEFEQTDFSLRVVNLSGTAHLAMPVALNSSQRAWFPYDKLYRIDVELAERPTTADSSDSPSLLHVYCRTLPAAWLVSKQLRQPVSLQGLAIYSPTTSDSDFEHLPLCVLVDSPTWTIPTNVDVAGLQPVLKPEWLQLGQNGWNLTWADIVTARNQSKLASDEQEAFYSFVRVTSKPALVGQNANQNPLSLLGNPREHFGEPVSWLVRLVQATVVQVANPQAVQSLGADRYYQLDGFVDIGKQKIRYKVPLGNATATTGSAQTNSEVIEFQGEFPITIVSLGPQVLTVEQLASGRLNWEVRHYATLEGNFYRLWSYHSELLESKGSPARQIAPLVVASSLTLANSPAPTNSNALGWFNAAICVVVLGVLGVIGFYILQPQSRHVSRRR